MITYRFIIYGNQDNPEGNPIPYHRSTQGSTWNPASKRYAAWKSYVVQASGLEYGMDVKKLKMLNPIVIPAGCKAYMTLAIHFVDNTHADSDNIFKGIADALFVNDKKLAGRFDFTVGATDKGRVEVTIKVYPQTSFDIGQIPD